MASLGVLAGMEEREVSAQVYVIPRRPGTSRVRHFSFDWQQVDLLVGEKVTTASTSTSAIERDDATAAGGIRLYYYRQEREIIASAAAQIESSYRELVKRFHFVPERIFPYVLYSSYQEFLQTNLFPLQEGVLGVTSTVDLKLALPYFGDFHLFEEVSRHEMVHQFTIQKVRTLAYEEDVLGDPLRAIPLWFVEGIAEFYAQRGIDDESEMVVLDLILNPDVEKGYGMLDFFDDRPFSTLWTYKVGQVRCAFLEAAYGSGTLQRIIESSPRLAEPPRAEEAIPDFSGLLEFVTGDEPEVISSKFEEWVKRRTLASYLAAKQGVDELERLSEEDGFGSANEVMQTQNSAPSGNLLLYRTIDIETGQSRLVLVDPRAPDRDETVAVDNVPGVESLHPVSGRSFDLTDRALVYVAQISGGDILYWQAIEHEARPIANESGSKSESKSERSRRSARKNFPRRVAFDVDLGLGKKIAYDLRDHGILAAFSPAFSPDGRSIAFVGLDASGHRDVFLLRGAGEETFEVVRLTNDEYAERTVAFGSMGVIFSSDRTASGKQNLFRVEPNQTGRPEDSAGAVQITWDDRDHLSPAVLPDGRIVFVAFSSGRANIYEVTQDGTGIRQLTDVATGLFDVGPGPSGGVWALLHRKGRRVPAKILATNLLDLPIRETSTATIAGPPLSVPKRDLNGAFDYEHWNLKNWELNNVFALLGIGGGSVFGRILAATSDRLRTHGLLLDLAVAGNFELTEGYLLYVNEERRTTWGLGPFQSLRFRLDQTFSDPASGLGPFFAAERFFGGLGVVRYPFNRFVYAQADLSVGGVDSVLSSDAKALLGSVSDPGNDTRTLLDVWRTENQSVHFQAETTLRLGYDTIRYHPRAGPISGNSLLLEGSLGTQPFDGELFTTARVDAEQYVSIFGRVNMFVRAAAGSTFGGEIARQFFLSSFDTLRGVDFGNTNFLLGRSYFFATSELQIPLNLLIAVALFTDIEGIVGVDFGGTSDQLDDLLKRRVFDFVLGVNLALAPLVFRLHFAKPIDVGAPLPRTDGSWVTNFSIGWLYF